LRKGKEEPKDHQEKKGEANQGKKAIRKETTPIAQRGSLSKLREIRGGTKK